MAMYYRTLLMARPWALDGVSVHSLEACFICQLGANANKQIDTYNSEMHGYRLQDIYKYAKTSPR